MNNKDIDRQIAEKVMGWKRIEGEKAISEFENQPQIGDRFHRKGIWVKDGQRMACEECGNLPQYADSISDAWQVVEKMTSVKDKEVYFEVCRYSNGACATFIGYLNQGYSVSIEANTAPLAICKAALKAVESETPSEKV